MGSSYDGDGAYGKRLRGSLLTSSSPDGEALGVSARLGEDIDSISINTQGASIVSVYIQNALDSPAFLDFDVSYDGVLWLDTSVVSSSTGLSASMTEDAFFAGMIPVGFRKFRVVLNGWVNGYADVVLACHPVPSVAVSIPAKLPLTAGPAVGFDVGGGITEICDENLLRRGLVVANDSPAAQVVYLSFGANDPAIGTGIALRVGQSFTMSDYTFTTDLVKAIGSAVGAIATVQEFE